MHTQHTLAGQWLECVFFFLQKDVNENHKHNYCFHCFSFLLSNNGKLLPSVRLFDPKQPEKNLYSWHAHWNTRTDLARRLNIESQRTAARIVCADTFGHCEYFPFNTFGCLFSMVRPALSYVHKLTHAHTHTHILHSLSQQQSRPSM